ncbi:tRNA pseudouridine(65) synthase TruC [Propionivibrio limicola]|uniref:tRNA pseudouridine(65) synthase TruC n=1 Tax=Propionivibrio limicola TaxID=167645 RepID=UPI001FE7C354|nr:tRNA pseudouridine(65) synthase TruC [Propionivibrio limicola]
MTTTPKEELPILYRDEYLIAVHKPSGLLVHRTFLDRHETRFAVQLLRDQIGQHVHPTHRLDRGTSGILLFALDRDVCSAVGKQFEAQNVDKTYLAIVRGYPDEAGRIDHPLTRQFDDYEFRKSAGTAEAQEAVTTFRRLATVELPYPVDRYPTSRYALLELKPETGRKHQLRRHLKHISHPIIGDATYGKGRHNRLFQELFGCHRLLLACTELRLTHPVSGDALRITCPLAEEFRSVLVRLGWDRVV